MVEGTLNGEEVVSVGYILGDLVGGKVPTTGGLVGLTEGLVVGTGVGGILGIGDGISEGESVFSVSKPTPSIYSKGVLG